MTVFFFLPKATADKSKAGEQRWHHDALPSRFVVVCAAPLFLLRSWKQFQEQCSYHHKCINAQNITATESHLPKVLQKWSFVARKPLFFRVAVYASYAAVSILASSFILPLFPGKLCKLSKLALHFFEFTPLTTSVNCKHLHPQIPG